MIGVFQSVVALMLIDHVDLGSRVYLTLEVSSFNPECRETNELPNSHHGVHISREAFCANWIEICECDAVASMLDNRPVATVKTDCSAMQSIRS